jgi:D-sedoheptulose 7-phosphate isomerase
MTSVSRRALAEALRVLDELLRSERTLAAIDEAGELLTLAFRAGKKAIACGNGGSLCDAMHFCEELTGRFRKDRPALPALALADPGHITCVGNDYGFERVFSRGVEAFGASGDVLVALSTSGNSKNVVLAVDAAEKRGMKVITLLGKDGGALRGRGTAEIIVPGATTDRIQELHMLILHSLVERVEAGMGFGAVS